MKTFGVCINNHYGNSNTTPIVPIHSNTSGTTSTPWNNGVTCNLFIYRIYDPIKSVPPACQLFLFRPLRITPRTLLKYPSPLHTSVRTHLYDSVGPSVMTDRLDYVSHRVGTDWVNVDDHSLCSKTITLLNFLRFLESV